MEPKRTAEQSRALSRRVILTGAAGAATVAALGVSSALPAAAAQQGGWRWCNWCQCLFYGGNYTTGWCERGGGHNYRDSGEYLPHYNYNRGQDNWRWCQKCQSIWYGGGQNVSDCPAGNRHDSSGSGNYSIEYGNNPGGRQQSGWRWCNKCYCLCYSGNGRGHCPQGGQHNFDGSGSYYLPYA
jgi:hypothetical protein